MKLQLTIFGEEDAQKAVNLLNTYLGTTAMQPVTENDAPQPEAVDMDAVNYLLEDTPPAANGDVELDSKGTPWLEAVHAGTKTKNQDGSWKKKRGVDETVLAEAEAAARGEVAQVPPTDPVQAEMPMTMPTEVMQPTVSIDDVHGKWAECMQAGKVTVEGAMDMYAEIGVDPSQLQTNETERAKLFAHLEGLLAA